jgi:spore maturation protein CgeB
VGQLAAVRPTSAIYTGHYIVRQEKASVFRSTGVVLNILHSGEMASMNCGLFEAAGCGAAILTEARPDLERLFEVGPEVASYDSFDVLADRARWMLDHPDAARAMGDRAAARPRHLTYELRLEQLLAALPQMLRAIRGGQERGRSL